MTERNREFTVRAPPPSSVVEMLSSSLVSEYLEESRISESPPLSWEMRGFPGEYQKGILADGRAVLLNDLRFSVY